MKIHDFIMIVFDLNEKQAATAVGKNSRLVENKNSKIPHKMDKGTQKAS